MSLRNKIGLHKTFIVNIYNKVHGKEIPITPLGKKLKKKNTLVPQQNVLFARK